MQCGHPHSIMDKTESKSIEVREENQKVLAADQNSSTATKEDAEDNSDPMPSRRSRPNRRALILYHLMQSVLARFVGLCSILGLLILLAYWLYDSIGLLILLHIAVLGVLYNEQDRLLFYPQQPPQSQLFVELPSLFGLPYENITVQTDDGVNLHMFLIRQPPSLIGNAPTVIYFHGNAGNIGHRLPNAHGLYHCCKANILLVEYRGYGKSKGRPSERGLHLDAQAALDYIFTRSDIDQQRLVVFGRSLGGAVAIRTCSVPYYASRVACLVVENTFTTIREMAFALFETRVLHYIPDWCYKNKFPSRHRIAKVERPTLFIVGLKDSLVPPKMTLQLHDLSGSQFKRIGVFQDGTHNETWQCRGYYDTLNQFFTEVDRFLNGKTISVNGCYMTNEMYQDGVDEIQI